MQPVATGTACRSPKVSAGKENVVPRHPSSCWQRTRATRQVQRFAATLAIPCGQLPGPVVALASMCSAISCPDMGVSGRYLVAGRLVQVPYPELLRAQTCNATKTVIIMHFADEKLSGLCSTGIFL